MKEIVVLNGKKLSAVPCKGDVILINGVPTYRVKGELYHDRWTDNPDDWDILERISAAERSEMI